MGDIYRKIRLGAMGPGGFKCPCCNGLPARGKLRNRLKRSMNKRGRTRLDKYLPLDEE